MESKEIIQQHISDVLKSTKVKTTGRMILKSIWLLLKNLVLFVKECFVYLAYFRVKMPCIGLAIEIAIIVLVGFFPSIYFYSKFITYHWIILNYKTFIPNWIEIIIYSFSSVLFFW